MRIAAADRVGLDQCLGQGAGNATPVERSGPRPLTLKTPYRDGTTHIVLELMARLAALVPPPRSVCAQPDPPVTARGRSVRADHKVYCHSC